MKMYSITIARQLYRVYYPSKSDFDHANDRAELSILWIDQSGDNVFRR